MENGQTAVKEKEQAKAGEMTFLEHLEQLRWHLIRSLVAIVIIGIGAFLAKQFVFDTIIFGPKYENFPTYQFFCQYFNQLCVPPDFIVQAYKVEEKFVTHLKVSILLGFIAAFPYVFWEMWRFIKPGLYPNERKAARGIVFICSTLFLIGVGFGYFIICPFALNFLTGYELADTAAEPTLTSYVNNMAMYTLPTGLIFELPVVVYFFSKIGLVTPAFLRKYRRMAFIIILILSAIITPPDVITQMLITIPVYLLYEVSIIISKRVEKAHEAEFSS